MKKVLLSCVALAAGTAVSMAQDLPVFPESFEVTANSESIKIWQGAIENIAESGVEVSEDEIDFAVSFQAENAIVLSGTTDSENVSLSFALPQGWAGVAPVKLNMQPMGNDSMLKTRANDFEPAPLQEFLGSLSSMGWFNTTDVAYGNPVVFPANGEKQVYLTYLYLTDDGTLTGDPEFAGDYVDTANSVLIVVDVENGGNVAEEPAFPATIEYTINGEKELAGVEVTINDNGYGPTMSVTGKSDAETVTLTLAVPEGWDGWIISAPFAEVSEQSIAATRGEDDWMPVDVLCAYMGYQKGNTVTFAVEEEDNFAVAGLYKGDLAYGAQNLTIEYNVVPASSTGGGDDDPVVSEGPIMPESIGITTFVEGLVVEQEKDADDGSISIDVTGTIEEMEYDIVLDVPEGWDGFVVYPFSNNVTVGEYGVGPRKAASVEHQWVPIEDYLADGCFKGNKLTLKANGNYEFVYVNLYKGDLVDDNAFIGITALVSNVKTANNLEEYEKVVATINDLEAQYKEAIAEAKEKYPDYDFSEWEYLITDMINQSYSGANQAYEAANEDGEAFQFAFYGEEIEAMIAEMKIAPIMEENYAAYDLVIAEINAAKADYEEALEFIADYNPEADITEMKEIIENAISDATTGAEMALNAAHEDGEAFNFAFSNEEIEGMIIEMKKIAVAEPNEKAYAEVYQQIEDVKAEYANAVEEIATKYPDADVAEQKADIEKALEEASNGAKQALEASNEYGEAFFFPFSNEDIMIMIQQMVLDAQTSGVGSVNAADKASYYDLNGNQISTPKAGMYIKVVDGKATKVVVK